MTDSLVVLDPPNALAATRATEQGRAVGVVGLLVDDSVAAIAAATWAARFAGEKRSSLLVIVLVRSAQTRDEMAAALLARVQPTLDRAGSRYSSRVCSRAGGTSPGRRARRTARRVGRLLPDDTTLLVCPGADRGLAVQLADVGTVDLLVVPDLSSVSDARSGRLPAGSDRPSPGGTPR